MRQSSISGVIDSSSLIALYIEWYSPDVFKRLWIDIEVAAKEGKLITVRSVPREPAMQNQKELLDWVNGNLSTAEQLFPGMLHEIYRVAGDIASSHRTWSQSPQSADPYVIAASEVWVVGLSAENARERHIQLKIWNRS